MSSGLGSATSSSGCSSSPDARGLETLEDEGDEGDAAGSLAPVVADSEGPASKLRQGRVHPGVFSSHFSPLAGSSLLIPNALTVCLILS